MISPPSFFFEDDIYEAVFDELQEYFDGRGDWFTREIKYTTGKVVNKEYFKIKIRDFEEHINQYLKDGIGYANSGTLENEGSYVGVLIESAKCLSVRFPEYPSGRKVDNYINEDLYDIGDNLVLAISSQLREYND